MASPQSNHDDHEAQSYGSPTSTLSSGFGQSFNTYYQGDDNLPEVVTEDTRPLSPRSSNAEYKPVLETNPGGVSPENLDDTAKVVVPSEDISANQYPRAATSANLTVSRDSTTTAASIAQSSHVNEKVLADEAGGVPSKEAKIMGLDRKPFFILLAVVVVIVIVAIGAGVGGAVAATRNHHISSSAAASTTSSASPTTTSPQSSATSSAPSASPTFLNNQTAPSGNGFMFQGFSRDNYTGAATRVVTREGGTDFDYDIHSYVWLPNLSSCCISFCSNATKEGLTGYWCNKRLQKAASASFARLFVWCGSDHSATAAKCV